MPTSARTPNPALVDTSVAVALVVEDHAHHEAARAAVAGRRLGLAGHAAFETYSVLTRLPAPARRSPGVVGEILRRSFPVSAFLPPEAAAALLDQLPSFGVAGGNVYDALVGAASRHAGLVLLTRDRRAAATYLALAVQHELIG
ncbi:MAG: PIN domain-containing protein [Acidimicrobiales bacterium]